MTSFLRSMCALALTAGISGPALACDPAVQSRQVDLVICLDTSGSMSGLIDAARQKLWAIVNDLATAQPSPELRVALLTFGNDGDHPENGWVAVQTEFTSDLDLVSQRLFALTTNGGTEYVGRVLQSAVTQLQWSPANDALKLIVVAGNESADQDRQVSFRDMCKRAIESGIMVNSIYCGNIADGDAPAWKEVATLADGHFAAIDQNSGTVIVSTPFDDEMASLSAAMNATYIPMGEAGWRGAANQTAQDGNAAASNSEAAAARAATKAGALYVCSWDLVDACKSGQVKLEEVDAAILPEALQAMSAEERMQRVEAMAKQRADIQAKIAALNQKRQAFIDEEAKRAALEPSRSFDHAVRQAVRAQAQQKGFTFDPAPEQAPSTN